MPIIGQCKECGHKFQAPDHLAGKRVKCPNCSTPLRIERAEDDVSRQADPAGKAPDPAGKAPDPAGKAPDPRKKASVKPEGSQPPAGTKGDWYVQTSDGQHHGPVEKAQLDKLAATGRLDGFCRIRREDWKNWRWAEDIYPQLASSPKSDSKDARPAKKTKPDRKAPLPTPPSPTPESQLVTCPDCGKAVSRRASQCPHCGCPAAILSRQEPPEEDSPPVASKGPRRRRPVFWFVTGGAVVALVVVALVSVWAWNWLHPVKQVVDQFQSLAEDPTPPPPEPTHEVLSPEELQQYMEEASAMWAKKVDSDSDYRIAQLATSLIGPSLEMAELTKAITEGGLDAIPDAVFDDPRKLGADSYESQYDSLYQECMNYVRQNLPPEEADRLSIWNTAKGWHDAKKAALVKDLLKEVKKRPEL